uniref:Uncharacterized protein n=1 Tax=Salix viminalis TaxID=40686 RepID=A0A6N2L0L9_SALVM
MARKEDKDGLDCQNVVQPKKSGGVQIAATQSSLSMLTAGPRALLISLTFENPGMLFQAKAWCLIKNLARFMVVADT